MLFLVMSTDFLALTQKVFRQSITFPNKIGDSDWLTSLGPNLRLARQHNNLSKMKKKNSIYRGLLESDSILWVFF